MEKKIIDYLNGNLGAEDQQELLNWLREEEGLAQFNQVKEAWWQAKRKSGKSISSDLSLSRLSNRLYEKQQLARSRKLASLYKYAAVFLLLLAIGSSVLLLVNRSPEIPLQFTEVNTEYGQVSSILLPDSSKVWINSGTSLVYNNHYGIDNRDVEVKGEAFFAVEKNRGLPFKVDLGELRVEVTGTRFGVSNYDDSNSMHVVLEEGAVNVQSQTNQLLLQLKPEELALFDRRSMQLGKTKVNPDLYTSWKEGIIHIYNQPLSELVLKLEKRYNQRFEIDPKAGNIHLTFSIENESLAEVLLLIEKIASVKAVQRNEIIQIQYQPKK